MYQQYHQIEKYHLVTMQEDLQRELKHISLLQQAEGCREKPTTLQNMLAAAGWRLVQIGTRLVERNGLTDGLSDCDLNRQPDTQAPGLA